MVECYTHGGALSTQKESEAVGGGESGMLAVLVSELAAAWSMAVAVGMASFLVRAHERAVLLLLLLLLLCCLPNLQQLSSPHCHVVLLCLTFNAVSAPAPYSTLILSLASTSTRTA